MSAAKQWRVVLSSGRGGQVVFVDAADEAGARAFAAQAFPRHTVDSVKLSPTDPCAQYERKTIDAPREHYNHETGAPWPSNITRDPDYLSAAASGEPTTSGLDRYERGLKAQGLMGSRPVHVEKCACEKCEEWRTMFKKEMGNG